MAPVLLLSLWACGQPSATSMGDATVGGGDGDVTTGDVEVVSPGPPVPEPPSMSPPTSHPIGADGRSEAFQVTLPTDHDVLGILVEPSPPWERPDLCFQLEEVTTDAGETWVPAASAPEEWGRTCGDCDQRVFLTWGSGFYLFPNGAEPLSPGTRIHGRVALRDCLSRLPVSEAVDGPLPPTVDVSWASWKEPPEDAPLYLPVHLVVASALLEDAQPSPVMPAVQYAT
ncbi:MAG: hypothetical protein VX938_07005, partial [Myxococcota bacterium]|nr:hypothetical protein [Myxococcota bacterium]